MSRYLIVDDSPTVRLMVKSAIRKLVGEGAEIDEVEDADAALASFKQRAPSVVFLDMMLARQSTGAVALDTILREKADAKVVLVTGLPPTHPDVIEAISRGAFGFIAKPVRSDAIRDILDQIAGESGSQIRIR